MKTILFPVWVAATLLTPLRADVNEGLPALAVQTVIFQVPSAIGLTALETPTTQDPALFEQMVAMVADGKAEIVFDQTLTARSGQVVKGGVGSEFSYPTEHEPNARLFQAQPTAFQTRHLGDRMECAAVLGVGDVIDARFKIESVALKRIEPCATANISGPGPAMGGVDQPLFVSSETLALVGLSPGRPMLIGLAPAMDIYESDLGSTAPHGTRVVFARVTVLGSSEVSNPTWQGYSSVIGSGIRLHSIGIRLPTASAAKMLQVDQPDASELLAGLIAMVRRGEATLVHHAAGVMRSGNTSHTTHIAEVIHANELDPLIPTSFVTRFLGTDAEFEATLGVTWDMDATASISEYSSPRFARRGVDLGNPAFFTTQPEFPGTIVRTKGQMHQGGVFLLGAASAAPGLDVPGRSEDTTDLYFLKAAATAAPVSSSALSPMIEQTALLYSVNEAEAAALQGVLFSDAARREAAQELAERLEEGACHLAALAVVGGRRQNKSKIESGLFGTAAEVLRPLSVRPGVFARLPKREQCFGVSFEAEGLITDDDKNVEIKGALRYDPAPPLGPPDEALRAALATVKPEQEGLVEAPAFTETFTLPENTKFADDESRLLAVKHSLAPDGSPESGRWHALVLRVRLVKQ